jgi:hypothetical protein
LVLELGAGGNCDFLVAGHGSPPWTSFSRFLYHADSSMRADTAIMGGDTSFLKEEVSLAFSFLLLVPDTESITIPEQDFHSIAITIQE